jgi:uncharacterized protein YfkK (UPF0435 family)
MKKLSILIALFIAITSCKGSEPNNDQEQIKRYKVESGIVEYKTTINGKVMGSTITGSGVQYLYFKNWGAIELQEENSTQTSVMKFFGKEKKETTTSHTMHKIENTKNYIVDFDKELITVANIPGMALMGDNKDAEQAGKDIMISMGGEKIGDGNFMGYNCEIWSVMGAKQWVHKGVMLKMEMSTLGITTITEAVSVKFDVSVPDDKFQLPNYKIEEAPDYMNDSEYQEGLEDIDENMDIIANMTYEEWKKVAVANDEEMQEMSEEELRQTYDMIQKMIKMRKGE